MSAQLEQRASEILDGLLDRLNQTQRPAKPLVRLERRAKLRVTDSLPARIWGLDSTGEMMGLDCSIDNLSSSGVFLRIPCQLQIGSQINLVIRLTNGSGATAAIKGRVIRDDSQIDGSRGIAVAITHHCFI